MTRKTWTTNEIAVLTGTVSLRTCQGHRVAHGLHDQPEFAKGMAAPDERSRGKPSPGWLARRWRTRITRRRRNQFRRASSLGTKNCLLSRRALGGDTVQGGIAQRTGVDPVDADRQRARPLGRLPATKLTDTGVTRRDSCSSIIVWREAGREVPSGNALVFRDGNQRNFALDNLELVSRAELMRRNGITRYG